MFGKLETLRLDGQGYRVLHDWYMQFVPSLALIARQRWLEENAARDGRALRGTPEFGALCTEVWSALDLPPA
jgi:hypothetical protein